MLEREDEDLEAEQNLHTQHSHAEVWDRKQKGKAIVACSSDSSEQESAGCDSDDDNRDYDSEDYDLTQRIVDLKRKGEEEDIFCDLDEPNDDMDMDSDSDCIFVSQPAEPLSFNKVKKRKISAGKGPTDKSHCSQLSIIPADFVPSDDDEKFDDFVDDGAEVCLGCSLLEEGRARQRR